MIKVALKGIAGRKIRAVLTGLAIVLGVAMVSGPFVLTDTISKAFNGIFSESYEGTDVVINGRQLVDFSSSGRATISAELLATVKELPDVKAAAGGILDLQSNSNPAKLVGMDGKPIGGAGGAPTMGVGLDASQLRFTPLRLTEGRWAAGRDEVVIDAGTAGNEDLGPGDSVGVAALGPVERYRITGVARFGSVDSIGGATITVFDLPTAQALYDKEGRFDLISVAAKDGVAPEKLVRELAPLLPASAQVKTSAEHAAADAKETNEGLSFITYFLLAFAGIALFVGSFVIYNTLSITVAQRTREFATVRTLGASRRQVLRAVILEGFVIGLVASLIGLFLGVGLGKGLNSLFVAFGIDLPQAGTVFATRTIIVSLFVGTLVTVLASIVPAVRATRVPPILAVREGSTPPRPRFAAYSPYVAGGLISVAIAALAYGLFAPGLEARQILLLLGVGVFLLFIGVAMLASRLVRPLAALVGLPARKIGGPAGRLARQNSVRNPARTAATAAALMIGLALVTFVSVLGSGLSSSVEGGVEEQISADYVVTSKNGFDPFTRAAGDALASATGVDAVSNVRSDQARVGGSDIRVSGVDRSSTRFYDYAWTQGANADVARLGSGGAVVQKRFADDHDLSLGSAFTMQTPAGRDARFVVRAIYDPPLDPLFGEVVIRQQAFDRSFPRPRNLFTFVDVRGGATEPARRRLEETLGRFADTKLHTESGFVSSRTAEFRTIIRLLYVLLALSVVVSLFGMVNTLVLSVFERTRELGMLRAVGMTRRQARQMVRHESVITALIGAALGMPLGVFLAVLITKALSQNGEGVVLSLPVRTLAIFAIVAILAGVLAAVLPARRASRLNVLEALQYE